MRDGNLYGRGACDMKGGVAAMTFAARRWPRLGVRLRGDLIVNTVTDEESSGAGGLAAVSHGVKADAGIVTEPTAFDVWVGCRGSLSPTITVEGRPGHAEMAQPHWRDGGAVNAIEKMSVVLEAIRELREEWRGRARQAAPPPVAGDIVPAIISGGEWVVTYPSGCTLQSELMYLPCERRPRRLGHPGRARGDRVDPATLRRRRVAGRAPAADRVEPRHPALRGRPGAPAGGRHARGERRGRASRRASSGLDSWFDAASFTPLRRHALHRLGARATSPGRTPIDEYVPVDDLVRCAQGLALAAIRYCGADG